MGQALVVCAPGFIVYGPGLILLGMSTDLRPPASPTTHERGPERDPAGCPSTVGVGLPMRSGNGVMWELLPSGLVNLDANYRAESQQFINTGQKEGQKKVREQIPKEGQTNVKRMSNKITVNSWRPKEGQNNVLATEEGQKKVKRRSKEGPGKRRKSEEGQKKVPATEESQRKVRRRPRQQKKVKWWSKEGSANRRRQTENQKNVRRRSRQQKKVKRRSKECQKKVRTRSRQQKEANEFPRTPREHPATNSESRFNYLLSDLLLTFFWHSFEILLTLFWNSFDLLQLSVNCMDRLSTFCWPSSFAILFTFFLDLLPDLLWTLCDQIN